MIRNEAAVKPKTQQKKNNNIPKRPFKKKIKLT